MFKNYEENLGGLYNRENNERLGMTGRFIYEYLS